MIERKIPRHERAFRLMEGLFSKNTVLEKGLLVAPVVVVTSNLRNAVVLSMVFSVLTFLTVSVSSFFPKKMPHIYRVIISVLLGGALYIPCAMAVDLLFPGVSYQLGIFLPILITNSLIVWRGEARFYKESRARMFGDLFFHIVGFWVVICLVGFLRELIGNGTIWDIQVLEGGLFSTNLPFSGFLMVGFLAALLHRFSNQYSEDDLLRVPTKEYGYQTYEALIPSEEIPESDAEEVVSLD